MPPSRFSLFAVAPPGLEGVVARELASIGIAAAEVPGGAEWEGGWDDLVRAHLHLRTASRVLVRVGGFRARALGELERKAEGLEWARFLGDGRPIAVRVSSSRSRIYHEGAAEERIRRALGRAGLPEAPPEGDEDEEDAAPLGPGFPLLVVRLHRDRVTVSIDASGALLHRRGYRLEPGSAPLRETLAAAALLESGWTPGVPLADPFAGSGTIAIEAALVARHIPPALATAGRTPRAFAFLEWPEAPKEGFAAAVDDARANILEASACRILASDRDAGAVGILGANAQRAGVLDDVDVQVAPFGEAPLPEPPGWIVTNPPYGARLGERRRLRALYRAIGRRVREEGKGIGLAFFSGDAVLERATALELEERFATRTGGLRVRLLAHGPPAPGAGGG